MSNAATRSPFLASSLDGCRRVRWGIALAIALGAHGALAFGLSRQPVPRHAPAIVTELELAPPPPPAPPEPDKPEPAPPQDTAPPPTKAAAPASPMAHAAPAARAGNVLVAKSDAPVPPDADPVDFVTDHGTSYQGGVVARGGTGAPGSRGTAVGGRGTAPVATAAKVQAPKSDITPASDLSRQPALHGGSGCSGYYPRSAEADSATAIVVVVVGADGGAARVTLASESPAGQGFGAAARACMRSSRFQPGLDKSGRPVKAVTTVRVHFTR